jgi:hypothetical protein
MKALACSVLAVAAVVVSLAVPAGSAAYPDDGKVLIKNRTRFTLGISRTTDSFLFVVPPGKTFKAADVNRFNDLSIDFDADNDNSVDTTYQFNLSGSKTGKYTVGDVGIFSITTQQ